MRTLTIFFQTSVGRKTLMAITGILLVGFLFGHMLGNLQILMGQDALNSYAEHLQSLGPALWVIRIGLLTLFLTHVYLSIVLKRENSLARPVKYQQDTTVKATIASRTMILSGLVILAFLIYHILHYTMGVVPTAGFTNHDYMGRHDVYTMVVRNFRSLPIALSYVIAVALLSMHLRHAIQSALQTMGFHARGGKGSSEKVSLGLAILIFIGYVIVPVSVFLNIVKLPGEV